MTNEKIKRQFGDIYDKFVGQIYRFIFLKVGTPEVAEDLTSETFMKAWKRFRVRGTNPNPDIENIQAFLYQIARNVIADYYRKKDNQILSLEEATFAGVQIPATDVQDIETKLTMESDIERVRLALAELKDEYREHLTWYYIEELSVPEIAKMTKRSEEAVRVTIHRALNSLKEKMVQKQTGKEQ